jgi:hypothetical protein
MRYSPRNIKVACDHEGLTHVGGIHFFHEFVRVLQLRNFLATHLTYPRRNNHYHLSQIISEDLGLALTNRLEHQPAEVSGQDADDLTDSGGLAVRALD